MQIKFAQIEKKNGFTMDICLCLRNIDGEAFEADDNCKVDNVSVHGRRSSTEANM